MGKHKKDTELVHQMNQCSVLAVPWPFHCVLDVQIDRHYLASLKRAQGQCFLTNE